VLKFLYKARDPNVILDIGACEGEDSLRYHSIFPRTRILAFEPLPKNAEIIRQALSHEMADSFEFYQCAIGGEDGRGKLHVSAGRPENAASDKWDYGNKSSSLLSPAPLMSRFHAWLKFEQTVTVDVLSLATVFDICGLDVVDFVHLDVQGAELEILRGAGDLVRKVRSVWLEVSDHALYNGQPTSKEVEVFMKSAGFHKLLDTRSGGFGDQFYVQPELYKVECTQPIK